MRGALALTFAIAIGLWGLPGTASADSDAGTILFARSGALWRISATGNGEPSEVVRVGDGPISLIALAPDRASAIVAMDDRRLLIRLPALTAASTGTSAAQDSAAKRPSNAIPLPCAGPAHFDPSGRNVVCIGTEGKLVVTHVDAGTSVVLSITSAYPHLSFLDSHTLALSNRQGLWAIPLSPLSGNRRRRLVPEAPSGAMLVAPDGVRAVAVYEETSGPSGGTSSRALFVFRLDGKGTRRRLLRDGEPLAWSADSRWVLVQHGEEACIVRATGGEYKCWDKYRAVALAPDGRFALLAKPREVAEPGEATMDLYKGALNGVSAARPTLLLERVDGAAAWLPE